MRRTSRAVASAAIAVLAIAPHVSCAQGRGIAATAEAEAEAGQKIRVLVIGAHPDDEDNYLLAWLARGHHAETAYLSLTRGDGGQNLIGSELGEALGVIRTEELLAARRVDGSHQYFARAYDFGFSKTADESFAHWPREALLGDIVKVVRGFRPQVIVAVFSGTPRDGHGQHQVSGILSREAYDVAADTVKFPARTFGAPWTPLKFYRGARFSPSAGTLSIDVGEYDPALGETYAEVAAESRSQHKSQGQGTEPRRGQVLDYVRREASRVNESTPAASERSMFDGLDTSRTVTQEERDRIALIRSGVVVEAIAPRERVALGDSVAIRTAVYRGGMIDSGSLRTVYVHGTRITQPYWLSKPRTGDMFAFGSDAMSDDERVRQDWLPVSVGVPGTSRSVVIRTPVIYRFTDAVRGEVERPLATAPGVSVAFDREIEIARAGVKIDRPFEVTLRSSWPTAHAISISLEVPAGMRADSASRSVMLAPGATRTVTFKTSGELAAGAHEVRAYVHDGTEVDSVGFVPIEYDHIRPQRMYRRAAVSLHAIDVALPKGVRLGYIAGAGDNVAQSLGDLDIPIEMIPAASLPLADLSRFTTIVVGPRAYQATPQLADNAGYLLDYVRRGGNLVVQYGQNEMERPGIMPYPVSLSRPAARVTIEEAPVTVLDPSSFVLTAPNKIGPADFNGWVQERATYMPSTFDEHYRTVLAMNDPGEPPVKSGILTADVGKGRYTYVTLALFRQLPAAVPGGVRIFANLLR